MGVRRIGFIVFPQFAALDLVGPLEAFSAAKQPDGSPAYEVILIGLTNNAVRAESGFLIQPNITLEHVERLDTLVIPGGRGLRHDSIQQAVSRWVRVHALRFRRVASVCTGIYALAPTGLLDGCTVTTHWGFIQDLRNRFPNLNVVEDQLFVRDGMFYSSAGVTAGIDLALEMISDDFGRDASQDVAKQMVVYLRRPNATPTDLPASTPRLAEKDDLIKWIGMHLDQDLSIRRLAQQACVSERQLNRIFLDRYGSTPAKLVESMRLEQARSLLASDRLSIDEVAEAVGFLGGSTFRRAFSRKYGIPPSSYRRSFGRMELRDSVA